MVSLLLISHTMSVHIKIDNIQAFISHIISFFQYKKSMAAESFAKISGSCNIHIKFSSSHRHSHLYLLYSSHRYTTAVCQTHKAPLL